jgi:hypothetical protein
MDPRVVERKSLAARDQALARDEQREREQGGRDDEDIVAPPAGASRWALTALGHVRR